MRAKRLFCIVFSLILCLTLCTPALAEGDLLFVAVNDSIPLTLTALPYESSSGIYVPYTAFDASPGGVIPAYNAQAQTFVLFTRSGVSSSILQRAPSPIRTATSKLSRPPSAAACSMSRWSTAHRSSRSR